MKKSVSFLLLNLALAVTLAAGQKSAPSVVANNIARFTGDPSGSTTLCPLPTQLVNHTVVNGANWQVNWTSLCPFFLGSHSFPIHPSNDGPHPDPAACLSDLQAFLSTLHWDTITWPEIENWLTKLHLDPTLISKLETWVESHHCAPGSTTSGSTDSGSIVDIGSSSGGVADSGDSTQRDSAPFELPPDAGTVAVPEPGPIALILSGAGLLSGVLLRRRSL